MKKILRKREIDKLQKHIKEREENIENLNHQQRWILDILKKRFQTPGGETNTTRGT